MHNLCQNKATEIYFSTKLVLLQKDLHNSHNNFYITEVTFQKKIMSELFIAVIDMQAAPGGSNFVGTHKENGIMTIFSAWKA